MFQCEYQRIQRYSSMLKPTKPRCSIAILTELFSISRTKQYAEIKKGQLKIYKYFGFALSAPSDVDAYVGLCRRELGEW